MQQQASRAAGRSRWRGHGEGVDNLGSSGRVFGVDVVEEAQDITEEGIGMMVGQPGMEAVESGMVRSGTEERQADKPAHEQIAGEVPFELAVRAGVSPGADEFSEDEGANGKGGRRARSRGMIVVATCADDSGWVVKEGNADEGMGGALDEHDAIDEGRDPGEDQGKKSVEEQLDG
jgi:hypothetical protein